MKKLIVIRALVTSLVGVDAADVQAKPRYCGSAPNGLAVIAMGPTSCAFARNTARLWQRTSWRMRPVWIRPYSPTTHRRYRMYCFTWRGNSDGNGYMHGVCKGANRAHVELWS